MDKVKEITLAELTEVIKHLKTKDEIFFAEDFRDGEALSWHTAKKYGKADENGIIVRHCGGTQFALWIDNSDYLEVETLVEYMESNSALGGNYDENCTIFLEVS